MRALAVEGRRFPVAGLLAWCSVLAWGAWALFGRIEVHVSSTRARVEATEPVRVLRAEHDGRLVAIPTREFVEAGDLLYAVDDADTEAALAAADARHLALDAERDVLEAAVTAADDARRTGGDVFAAALGEAQARRNQAQSALRQAEREAERLETLGANGVSTQDLERARTTARNRRSELDATAAIERRLGAEERRDASDRAASLEQLRQSLAALETRRADVALARQSALLARDRRRTKAPLRGRLADRPELRVGDYVDRGAPLGILVPDGPLHVVGWFPASDALGRVRPGQPARIRLDAFPWTWFGTLPATVTAVALESRDGLLRVELAPRPHPLLGHGLTATVDVGLEREPPLALLLRSAGQRTP